MSSTARRVQAVAFVTGAGLMTGLLAAGPASAREPEPWNVAKLHEFFCAEKGHSQQFYDDWAKGETMLPYELKRALNPAEEARKKLYGDAKLNADTAHKICNDLTGYTGALKNQILDLKGDLKPECSTAAGIRRFIHDKEVLLTEAAMKEQEREAAKV